MASIPSYSVAIRTLGKAGDKYQQLLNSLASQTHKPDKIVVYLAEGYPKPKETIGIEEIVYVKKGMVAQRALPYDEIETEWILFLDDDVFIEKDGVERMIKDTLEAGADVSAFDAFPHHKMTIKENLFLCLRLLFIPRLRNKNKAYTVSWIGTDFYNPSPKKNWGWSTTNAGPGFFCKKSDFLKIHFEEDLWLDDVAYSIPDDKVMFYKMHLNNLKIITLFRSGFKHLDAQTSTIFLDQKEKTNKIIFSSERNNIIFQNLYIKPSFKGVRRIIYSLLIKFKSTIDLFFDIFSELRGYKIIKIKKEARENATIFLKTKKI